MPFCLMKSNLLSFLVPRMTSADNGGKKRTRTYPEVNENAKKSAMTPKTEKCNMDEAFILGLPRHIILEIFLMLPVKTLLQCRSVCKAWRSIISGSQFASLHFSGSPTCLLVQSNSSRKRGSRNLSLVKLGISGSDAILRIRNASNFPKLGFEIVGSCNGLLCMYDRHNNGPIYISNPITGEYLSIPSAADDPTLPVICGFGFRSVNNEYKVVQILRKFSSDDKMEAKVWTLGANGWRSLGDLHFLFSSPSFGAFLNGKLHWVTDYSISFERICSFDLERENFKPLPGPPPFYYYSYSRFWGNAGVLEGCLSIGFLGNDYDHSSIDIWVMNDYEIRESWTKKYVVRNPRWCWWNPLSCQVIRSMEKSGDLLVLYHFHLFFYNPTTKKFRRVEIDGIHSLVEAICHVPSFLSPKTAVIEFKGISG